MNQNAPHHFKRIDNELVEEDGDSSWLLSYADMVTLLMCFFILFFNIEKPDESINDAKNLTKKLANLIGIEQSLATRSDAEGAPGEPGNRGNEDKQGDRGDQDILKDKLTSMAKTLKVAFTAMTPQPGVTEITFLNGNFFNSGNATLTLSGRKMIQSMIPAIKNFINPYSLIEVEGHSDGDPIRQKSVFPSNWELSAARAATVVRLLSDGGISSNQLQVSGFANTRPVAKEKDEAGRMIASAKMLNRRIVVRIKERSLTKTTPSLPNVPGHKAKHGEEKL